MDTIDVTVDDGLTKLRTTLATFLCTIPCDYLVPTGEALRSGTDEP